MFERLCHRPVNRILALAIAFALAGCGPNVGKADSYEQLADTMMSAGAYPAAISAMEKSVKNDSNEPRRWIKLARAQRSADQSALAAISYQHALDLDPANIEGLENMAILLVRAGQYTEARTYVDPLMALQPDDVAGLLALGAIAMYQKNWIEANKYADKLIEVAPSSIGGFSLKAHVLEAQGRPHAAAEVLAKQAALNPADLDIALQLMELYRKSNDVQGVRQTALALSKLVPNDPRYKFESARALWAKGDKQQATAILADLQQRYRGNPSMMEAIARFWLSVLPRDQGMAKLRDMTAKSSGRSQSALGDLLMDEGASADTVRLLAHVADGEVDPQNEDAFATYANALLAIGKKKPAGEVAQRVLDFDSANDVALSVRAQLAFEQKKYSDALGDAQLAMSGDNHNQQAALLVPRIYMAMGNKILAEKAWGDAQSSLPDDVEIHRERMDWFIGQNRLEDARQIASSFATAHQDSVPAWRIYLDLCERSKNICVGQANARLKQIG